MNRKMKGRVSARRTAKDTVQGEELFPLLFVAEKTFAKSLRGGLGM